MTVVAISAAKKTRAKAPAAAKAAAKKPAPRKGAALPDLNEHILRAFALAGGDAYLAKVAESHPSAFLSLLVKVLPLQLADEGGGALHINRVERVLIHPKA